MGQASPEYKRRKYQLRLKIDFSTSPDNVNDSKGKLHKSVMENDFVMVAILIIFRSNMTFSAAQVLTQTWRSKYDFF